LQFALTLVGLACACSSTGSGDRDGSKGNGSNSSSGTGTGSGGINGVGGGINLDVTSSGGSAGSAGNGGSYADQVAYCGDGRINRTSEACDDGNTEAGDGCTAECTQVEADWVCPTPGEPCVYTVSCGDGIVGGSETCDDGGGDSPVSGDGCDAECQTEEGFTCPVPGAACRPICGDGLLRGREQCDDGVDPPAAGDGCNETCALEPGWVCPEGEACRETVCGDGTAEGSERCDDGNLQPYDGCSPSCVNEPVCGTDQSPVGACVSTCGDGIMLSSDDEQCDDGNDVPGDGCDENCQLELGYECTTVVDSPPETLELPVVLRDFPIFQEWGGPGETNPVGHPDMNRLCCVHQPGIVEDLLGVDRKPVYVDGAELFANPQTTGQAYFDQWYRDVTDINQRFDQTLILVQQPDGSYAMDSSTDAPWADLGGYFPLENLGFGSENLGHNFFFTSELRYWFEYKGGEELRFSGDDDVWVFVNGRLAVDLGGVHNRLYGTILLDDAGHGLGCVGENCTPSTDIDFQMTLGNIYEVVVFQAERHPGDSNYFLTLANFLAGQSTCAPVCGDGVQTPDEACDLGAENNTGEHGGCNADCTVAPFCGDGNVDTEFGEACDDGVNTSLYGGCAPGCVNGPYCGDGQVQSDFEQCDDGENDGGYLECGENCQSDARCGDGVVQPEYEECDEGPNNALGALCLPDCTAQEVE